MYVYIQGVSIYMGPMWLLIIISFVFQVWKHYTIMTIYPWSQCFRFEWKKVFCITTYLETKSFKTVSKQTQSINMIMIYNWDKKLKKRLHVLEADITKIEKKTKKTLIWCLILKGCIFFTGCVPNDRHCICLSNKSLSY